MAFVYEAQAIGCKEITWHGVFHLSHCPVCAYSHLSISIKY